LNKYKKTLFLPILLGVSLLSANQFSTSLGSAKTFSKHDIKQEKKFAININKASKKANLKKNNFKKIISNNKKASSIQLAYIKKCEKQARTLAEKKACWNPKSNSSQLLINNMQPLSGNDINKKINFAKKNLKQRDQKKVGNFSKVISNHDIERAKYNNRNTKLTDKQFNQIKSFKHE